MCFDDFCIELGTNLAQIASFDIDYYIHLVLLLDLRTPSAPVEFKHESMRV
jgi:hypothetical protein